MGECALLVWFDSGISVPVNRLVHRLASAIRQASLRATLDVVPAYSSVLVVFDPELLPESELRARLEELYTLCLRTPAQTQTQGFQQAPEGQEGRQGQLHIIPTAYGGEAGPDLFELAQVLSLSPDEFIRLHSSRLYRVFFLGFLPGFAYMGLLHRALACARLSVPRVRVPPGSVGVAGRQTGIYPFASPGGWRVVGRVSVRVWDPYSSRPTLFSPGDTVRFVPTEVPPSALFQPAEPAPPADPPSWPALEVLEPGALTTVQDAGRPGLGHLGVSRGGAFDVSAALRANALVGNPPNAAVLEITWSGPTLRVLRSTAIALTGADLHCMAGHSAVPVGMSWFVRAGTVLRFATSTPPGAGMRAYLAVAGGVDVPVVLQSRSTYLPAGFGGYRGRPLQAGDVLGVCPATVPPAAVAGRLWPQVRSSTQQTRHVPSQNEVSLRFVPCEGPWAVSRRVVDDFMSRRWVVGVNSDRMGTRLSCPEGPPDYISTRRGELASFGVVSGAIQLPPGGSPLLLNVDHQTTGGYPLLGVVAMADRPLLAQLAPGQSVRFVEISVEQARAAFAEARAELRAGLLALGVSTGALPPGV
jgi:KipI family sensor histidine kinase inhibitor